MGSRVHYPAEIKWEAIKMMEAGHSSREISETLGIKNSSQVRIWIRWYRSGETHRFDQPVGKQYSYSKGVEELSEVEVLKLRFRQLEMQNEVLGKLKGISGK